MKEGRRLGGVHAGPESKVLSKQSREERKSEQKKRGKRENWTISRFSTVWVGRRWRTCRTRPQARSTATVAWRSTFPHIHIHLFLRFLIFLIFIFILTLISHRQGWWWRKVFEKYSQTKLRKCLFIPISLTFMFLLADRRGQQGHHPEGLPAPRDGVQVSVREEPLRQREQRRAGGVQEDHRQEEQGRDKSRARPRGSWGHHRSWYCFLHFTFISSLLLDWFDLLDL